MHDPCRCNFNRYKLRLVNLLTARHVIGPTQVHHHYMLSPTAGGYTTMPWQSFQWHPPLNWFYNGHWHKDFGTS